MSWRLSDVAWRRPRDLGSALFVLLLAAMTGVSLVAWRQLTRSIEQQGAATDDAIRDYAGYAARTFVEGMFTRFEALRLRTLAPALVTPGGDVLSIDAFATAARQQLERQGLADVADLGFFVYDRGTGRWDGRGAAADTLLARLIRSVIARTPAPRASAERAMEWAAVNKPAITSGYVSRPRTDGSQGALYGFTFARRQMWQRLGDEVMRELPLLPTSFLDPSWQYRIDSGGIDTLFSIQVFGLDGEVGYASNRTFAGAASGEFNQLKGPAAFRAVATLHPNLQATLRRRLTASRRGMMMINYSWGSTRRTISVPVVSLFPLLAALLVLVAAALLLRERTIARARRAFVGAVSHEFRTPLAAVRLYTETMQLGREVGGDERRRWLGIVSRESRRLGSMVENILLFSHLDAERTRLERELVDLGALVEDVVESMVEDARARDVRLIAEAPSRIMARVDPRAMRQLLVNLLDNALKFGPNGQVITVELEPVGDRVRILVSDQGPGVPAGARTRIWEPFVSVATTAGGLAGTGIGLAVVRGLVAHHGGTASVTEAPGGGARFAIEFPTEATAVRRLVMRPGGPMRRTTGRLAFSIVLVSITLLSGLTSWQLRRSLNTNRAATEQAIVDYAAFSARLFSDRVLGELEANRLLSATPATSLTGPPALVRLPDSTWTVIGRSAIRSLQLLPPSLVDSGWRWFVDPSGSDTIVAFTLTDRERRSLYQSRPHFPASPTGTMDTRDRTGGFLASATLHPGLVSHLRARLNAAQRATIRLQLPFVQLGRDLHVPVDVLIPLLSLLLGAAAWMHLTRERSLVRARRDFVASVSHELRTPLAQIRMFAETLYLGRERNPEERLRWLDVMSRESRRLGDLVENILLFSHLDADKARLEMERTDLGELIEEVVESCLPSAARREVRLVADAPSRIFGLVDPRALRQVIVNLVDNAIKYGPRGQVVSVELERDGRHARIAVSDQGPGISASDRKHVWDPFVRLGRASGTTGGSGIGLSVVRGLVEQHGGSVSIEDAPGGGARFVVLLPLAEASASPGRPPLEAPRPE